MAAARSAHRSIVFMAWGEKYVEHVAACIERSRLPPYPVHLITDETTPVECLPRDVVVLRQDLRFGGKLAKVELMGNLPAHLQTVLFLDVDTQVLDDISLGFEKAEEHGIAMAAAPHYSLEHFRNFGTVMDRVGVPRRGQLLYNSGVMFFDARDERIREIFRLACSIAAGDETAPWGDQTYITLAMEMLGVNPYTLSGSFNHRAFGELISGDLRVWHSYKRLPEGARTLERGFLHRYADGSLVKAKRVPL